MVHSGWDMVDGWVVMVDDGLIVVNIWLITVDMCSMNALFWASWNPVRQGMVPLVLVGFLQWEVGVFKCGNPPNNLSSSHLSSPFLPFLCFFRAEFCGTLCKQQVKSVWIHASYCTTRNGHKQSMFSWSLSSPLVVRLLTSAATTNN